MKKYLGVKIIEAEPMNLGDYNKFKGWEIPKNEDCMTKGYKLKYSDDYISWSPKDVFEKSYFELEEKPKKNSISESDIKRFIKNVQADKVGEKTTIVTVTLINGFEITDTSSCVDPDNYDHKIGMDSCLARINDKIWVYLGFMLQSGINGMKKID